MLQLLERCSVVDVEGVEILDTNIVYVTDFSFSAFIIPIIIGAIIGVGIRLLIDSNFVFVDVTCWTAVGTIAGLFIGIIICATTAKATDKISYIEYKVTISDEVSYNEFVAKYEVISQEGKTYIVREKNEVGN